MSNSAEVLSGYQSFVQKITGSRVINTLSTIMPTFDFLMRMSGHHKGPFGLGRVEAGDLAFGRINGISRPNKEKMFRERIYEPIVKKTRPTDSGRIKKMAYRDSTAAVPHPSTGDSLVLERFIQPRFKLSRTQAAATIWHDDKRTAFSNATNPGMAAKAILSVFEVEDKDAEDQLCRDINDELFGINGKSGAPSSEDAKVWDSIYSISKALDATSTYGGLDRTDADNAWWKGVNYTSAFTGTFEDLLNHVNYKVYDDLNIHGGLGGLATKGLAISLIVVGGDLFIRAKNEAKTRTASYQVTQVPDPVYGFTRDRVTITAGGRQCHVIYDPSMDSVSATTAYLLAPETWSLAIPSDRNFATSKILDLSELSEGGDERDAWHKEVDIMLACEVPSNNAIYSTIS